MWELLPIQRTTTPGRPGTMIDRSFSYPEYPNVKTDFWNNVPKSVQAWCMSVWTREFSLRRLPMGPTDILAWVPDIGILAAKRGCWIGTTRSFRSVYMCFNYVDDGHRGLGISGMMITTLSNRCTQEWGSIPFMFEIHSTVPRGLKDITPFLRFTYVWIPFLAAASIAPQWISIPTTEFVDLPGFHPNEMEGYLAFRCSSSGTKILLDPHNDIVHYDDISTALMFDALPIKGAYCRVFSPIGTTSVFLENMYYEPHTGFKEFLLA